MPERGQAIAEGRSAALAVLRFTGQRIGRRRAGVA